MLISTQGKQLLLGYLVYLNIFIICIFDKGILLTVRQKQTQPGMPNFLLIAYYP